MKCPPAITDEWLGRFCIVIRNRYERMVECKKPFGLHAVCHQGYTDEVICPVYLKHKGEKKK